MAVVTPEQIGFRGTNTGTIPRPPKRWTVMAWDLNDKLMLGEQHRDRDSANARAASLSNRSDVLRVRHFETDAPAKRPSGRAR